MPRPRHPCATKGHRTNRMSELRLFTSESVTEGHPDKICDQVSDSILDALLTVDPHSRVAVETLVTTGLVHVAGEVRTTGYVEIPAIVRERITSIGYDSSDVWFDGRSCGVSISIGGQSPDIAVGVAADVADPAAVAAAMGEAVLAFGGVDLVVGEAFGISREARKVADDYPEIAFLMGDPGVEHGSNFSVFDNWIHEPCYLMGVVAGTMTKTNKIGMVGGFPIGEVNRLFHAFMAGAKSVNPDVEFKVSFIGSWYDPPKAKEFAFAQVESGVDVLYAERAGVVDAAREKGIIAFGNVNDMNKLENGTDVVVASALWHMEPAIDYAIAQVKAGSFKAENYKEWTMMKAGGASLSPFYEFDAKIPAETKADVEALAAKIKAGEMVVEINDDEPKSTF